MIARAPNQPLEPPRRRVEVLRAEVLAEVLGLNPLENGEEEKLKEEKAEMATQWIEDVTIWNERMSNYREIIRWMESNNLDALEKAIEATKVGELPDEVIRHFGHKDTEHESLRERC